MDEEARALMEDLHVRNHRQGPGSDASSCKALALAGIDTGAPVHIADIGCGTGAASVLLASHTQAHVTAVDVLPAFLQKLERDAAQAGLHDRITTITADMSNLPFEAEQFDVLWSEGAIYNIGFSNGVEAWKKYLKRNGVLVVTEITYLSAHVPDELRTYWETEYPEIAPASSKLGILERHGYTPIGYFPLSPDCWLAEYYDPLKAGFKDFLARHAHNATARAIVDAETREIELYERFQTYYSYGCYIARR